MRIPFPERVPINRVAIFAAVLFAIQIAEGTALYFSAGSVVFLLIAAFAFNAGGGLTRASGAYVFSYSILVFIIGVCYKAFLGEPAQSNLLDPHTDIEVYVGGITAMLAAVIVSRRFSRQTGLLQNLLKESQMHRASVGCIAFGLAGGLAIALLGVAKLQTAFGQLNQLIPIGIIIGVMYEIRHSGGTRSLNLITVLAGTYMFIDGGVFFFSKQAMLTPLICWFLPVCALGYRLSLLQKLSCILSVFLIFHYLVPYSQYGRSQIPELATFSERTDIAISLLEHPEETRRLYYEEESSIDPSMRGLAAYYITPQGFWERLQFVSVDDVLVNFTDQGHVFGLLPIKASFLNAIPHVFWPNKPRVNFGNMYTHEINGESQNEGDTTTGISFSPTSEAYHMARWTGVLVIAPLLWCLFFIVFDSLFGDLRASPWGLLSLVLISHYAPEGGLSGLIYLLTFGVEGLIFGAFFATWFAPLLAIPILGPERKRSQSQISFRPTPAAQP